MYQVPKGGITLAQGGARVTRSDYLVKGKSLGHLVIVVFQRQVQEKNQTKGKGET